MSNPYRDVHTRLRSRQGGRWMWLLPVLAAAVATPFARNVLFGFVDEMGLLPAGVEAVTVRVGALVAAAVALHTYTDLIRGPDRPVLDPHPVLSRPLLQAIALRTTLQRAYLPLMGAILMSPLIGAAPTGLWVWLGCCAVISGAWLCALGVGFAIHLAAVWAALSPAAAGALSALRGDNPQMQAALIYSPGAALGVVGVAVYFASAGLTAAMQGWMPGLAFLLLPPIVGGIGLVIAGRLADRYYVRTTTILSEIDAQWLVREEAEEAGRVYLDWLATGRPELLRALRQGWRSHRGWALGAWGIGVIAGIAGWSDAADAATQVLLVASAGVLLITALPTRLAMGDPIWLDRALGVNGVKVGWARASVGVLYALGVVLPPAAALSIRHGLPSAAMVAGILVGASVLGAGLATVLAVRMRRRGVWVYGPVAMLLWSIILGGFS